MSARRRSRKVQQHPPVVVAGAPNLQPSLVTGTLIGIAALAAPSAGAATFNVVNPNDAGPGSLRQAALDANATAGPDVITFAPTVTGTITLTSGPIKLYEAVNVQGPGQAALTVDGNSSSAVFYIYAAVPTVTTISNLTVAHGLHYLGGAIMAGGNVTLDHVTVTTSQALLGGGVAFGGIGELHVLNSTITGNTALVGGAIGFYSSGPGSLIQDSVISANTAYYQGGGIHAIDLTGAPSTALSISRTTISGNTSNGSGGGISLYYTSGGQVLIDSSTISGNTASAVGGGIFLDYGNDLVTIENSTITSNQAASGGGIYLYRNSAAFNVNFSTISGNTATGSGGNVYLYNYTTAFNLSNSIIADGIAPTDPDVAGGLFNSTFSLVETPGSAGITLGPGTITGQDPKLGPLQNNGGPTRTRLPDITSPVIDAGDPAYVPPPAFDQRGGPRKVGLRVDMGAVEYNGGAFTLSAATYSVNENGGSVTITVTRSGGTDPATVAFATSNGTASAGADYTTTGGTLSFAAGQTSATFVVPILDDTLVEGNETFNVALSAPSLGSVLGAQLSAVVTIIDVEPGVLQFSAPTYSVNENGASVVITVTRTNGGTSAVTVNYATSNGTATSGADYTASSGTLTWAAGDSTSKTFTVPILDDTIVEGNETFNITLSAPTGGATLGSQSSAVVTIVDIEPGVLQFANASYSVAEDGGSVTVTVTRTNGSTGAVTVNYATSTGTATSGADFTATSGTITFAAGDATPKTIVIPITNDGIPEPPENFTVTLSTPGGGATVGAQSSTVVTITAPAREIPVLGFAGKMLLMMMTALTGLWAMGRRKLFGFLLAALFCGLTATTLHAQMRPEVQAKKGPHWAHSGAGLQANRVRHGRIEGVVASVTSAEGKTTITLKSGQVVTIVTSQMQVVDRRGKRGSKRLAPLAATAIAAGQTVVIVTSPARAHHAAVTKVKIRK
ncbi:MAG: Calx-beta domain-containing protein [Acidobacteriota bacterium]